MKAVAARALGRALAPGRALVLRPALALRPALVLGLALALLPSAAFGAVIEEIVAKVNNRIITKSEFEERGAALLRQVYEKYSGAELDQELRQAQDDLLANLITESLLLEQADALFDMDKIRQNLIEDFRKQQKIGSDRELEKLLVEQGMTRQELEDHLIRLALPQEIINHEVKRSVSVSEQEVKGYYDSHAREWEVPATATFREVVLLYGPDGRDEAMERAGKVVYESKSGAEFATLVERYSEAGTKEGGGLLGPLEASDLQPAIAAAAFALEPGEVSDPIDTGRSVHVIRLESKTPKRVKPLEEVQAAITETIRREKFIPRYDAYIRKLWKQGHVEVLPNYERYLVTSPLKMKPGGMAPEGETPGRVGDPPAGGPGG